MTVEDRMAEFGENPADTAPTSDFVIFFTKSFQYTESSVGDLRLTSNQRFRSARAWGVCLGLNHTTPTVKTEGGSERATPSAEFCGRKYATSPENWQRQSESHPKNGFPARLMQQSLPLRPVKGNKFGV
ncbi:MAG: hypothetical protein CMM07_09385 [Rhodopirellula sp.]|nr:hypothetical protein [Rhodopirellula sp.]